MSEDGKPKSGRGGKRVGAGRKPKGYVPPTLVAGIDLAAALAMPAPDDITSIAQPRSLQALEALVKLMLHGRSESARVTAANAVLDRGYGKPAVDLGGDLFLPFDGLQKPAEKQVDLRVEARKYAVLAIEVLHRIATTGESEGARASASKSIIDRGVGTVAVARVPESLRGAQRPESKKEQVARAASAAATGRYAVPAPPGQRLN